MARTIAVLGSTGQQGGAVARACLKDGWKVRGLTRNTSGKGAQTLAGEGAEMVSADIDDLDSLVKAFEGVQAVFCLTNFWELLFSGKSADEADKAEANQAYNVALAASKTPTLEHYLMSTLPNATELTKGERRVPHMDYKSGVDERIKKELPNLASKTTFIWMGWYSSNMANMFFCRPMEVPQTGKYLWTQPSRADALLPVSGNVTTNLGRFAVAVLAHPDKTRGMYVDVRTNLMTFTDILKVWSEVTGKEAVYMPIAPEAFNKLYGPAGVEMSMQYQSGELWGDWERLKGDAMVQPGDIGISKDQLVDLRGDLEILKAKLL
ncbi:uncharacterized protein LTR77_007577 [Saxophila tyrrhenica]|uniref:NmrA-like domain-containing protein n=1 Tax=Saxophila tyrrhenica TaxID=1690608 RepID=A0AAV9P349_9PEZI|nr:hypothetical protein LTR77_007577 [Saxophila tyrrhenica]